MQSIIDKLQTPQSFLQSVQVAKLISYFQGSLKPPFQWMKSGVFNKTIIEVCASCSWCGQLGSFVPYMVCTPDGGIQKPSNKDEQNDRFCWPTFQLILMLGILIGGRFCAFTCPTWNFLIWNQQNLHIKENYQHPAQLLPNKFITVLLAFIRRSLLVT